MVRIAPQQRAQRYAMSTPLRFREHGESAWHAASTLNISSSGVLFRVEGPPPDVYREVEFIVALPILGAGPRAEVRCTGRVVRLEGADAAAGLGCAAAATISTYEIAGRLPA